MIIGDQPKRLKAQYQETDRAYLDAEDELGDLSQDIRRA